MITNEFVMRSRQLAGRVRRYHAWPVIYRQSVGEHSARVASLYCELWGIPRAEVLYYCLHHDSGELASGDVPFYAKRAVPELREAVNKAELMGRVTLGCALPELSEQEFRRFKFCDLLEMWEFAQHELLMGNQFAELVADNIVAAVSAMTRGDGDENYRADSERVETWMQHSDEEYERCTT